jgi:hypothetical protein
MARAEAVIEQEPNDAPTEAMAVGGNAVVSGSLAAKVDPATGAKKPKGKAKSVLVDEDWFRLPATPPGQVVTIDLRAGPPCAELELYDDTGRTLLRRARGWKQVRPTLPSLGAEAHASLVRVVCYGKADAGGAYQLAIWPRAAKPDEELEPNDTVGPLTQVVAFGATMQGALAPVDDIDRFSLQLAGATQGEALMLSVTGVPDVELEVALLDPVTQAPLLVRRPGKGQPVVVPNLDLKRIGDHPLVSLKALSGAAPDASYALKLQTFLPQGCAQQRDCAAMVPVEREPNDAREAAIALAPSQSVSGVLDGSDDIDWWQVPAHTASTFGVATVKLSGPPGVAMALLVGTHKVTAPPGQPVVLAGVAMGSQPLDLQVLAGAPLPAPAQAYRLDVAVADVADFEVEGDDRQGLVIPTTNEGQQVSGGQRRGVLFPSGDQDRFVVDLSQSPGSGRKLEALGDGQPGLLVTLTDATGAVLAEVKPGATERAQALAWLPPGRYVITVQAAAPRPSLQPWTVGLWESPEAAALAPPPTPIEAE